MKKLLSIKIAGTSLLVFLYLLIVLHFLLLFGLLPVEYFWGGQLNDPTANVLLVEIVALIVTSLFILIVTLKMRKSIEYRWILTIGMWLIFVFFLLNALGNISSESLIENTVLFPLTLIMAVFAFRLAIEN